MYFVLFVFCVYGAMMLGDIKYHPMILLTSFVNIGELRLHNAYGSVWMPLDFYI